MTVDSGFYSELLSNRSTSKHLVLYFILLTSLFFYLFRINLLLQLHPLFCYPFLVIYSPLYNTHYSQSFLSCPTESQLYLFLSTLCLLISFTIIVLTYLHQLRAITMCGMYESLHLFYAQITQWIQNLVPIRVGQFNCNYTLLQ